MAMDWLIRVYTPAWLGLARLTDAAERLTSLPPVADVADLQAALFPLELARRDARAVWTALGAARAAAWAIPWAAGRSAAREAAWGSAGAAAWAAARLAVGDIAGDRARAAARAAAGDAAGAAVREARVGTERAAAREAARAALAPTLSALHESALALLDRMLPTETLVTDDAPALERVGDFRQWLVEREAAGPAEDRTCAVLD
jgi:hypothetical protein